MKPVTDIQAYLNKLTQNVTFMFPLIRLHIVFTALHGIQTRSGNETSVCLSVTRVNCDKTVERSVQIYIPYERTFSLVF